MTCDGVFANHCLTYTGRYMLGNSLVGSNWLAPWFSYPSRTALRRRFNLEGNCESLVLGNKVDKPEALSKQALTDQIRNCECGIESHSTGARGFVNMIFFVCNNRVVLSELFG
ncbi:hypothetical protein MKW92_021445 [Papaver armeniacum]|nr:hypothetical protein MKW92_021445 [Papaver armeniacum]